MTLISLNFALFVVISLVLYYLVPKKYQWIVLLLSSYVYYVIICNKYVLYLVFTTITTYYGARLIDKLYQKQSAVIKEHKEEWDRSTKKEYKAGILKKCRAAMIGVLVLNFGILALIKYLPMLPQVTFSFIQPLGISFYTFQAMGYLIDVYQEKVDAEKNIARFALFVSFFPQIIQGPIAIYDNLAHQFYEKHPFAFQNIKSGGALVLWGMLKKMVIADRAVVMINFIQADMEHASGIFVLAAVLMYALQLYADFSGGIDMVRGIGEMYGIQMSENFRRPYFSRSLTEYWHRWHITLGDWVRTYVFYPLSISNGFLKLGKWMQKKFGAHIGKVVPTCLASLITFLVIGVWHGANSKYIAFGLWNGLVIMIAELIRPIWDKICLKLHIKRESAGSRTIAVIWTFFLVLVGYYFDIAKSSKEAFSMLWRSITDCHLSDLINLKEHLVFGLEKREYLAILLGLVVLFCVSLIQERSTCTIRERLWKRSELKQFIVFCIIVFVIMIFGYYGPGLDVSGFVYMQF